MSTHRKPLKNPCSISFHPMQPLICQASSWTMTGDAMTYSQVAVRSGLGDTWWPASPGLLCCLGCIHSATGFLVFRLNSEMCSYSGRNMRKTVITRHLAPMPRKCPEERLISWIQEFGYQRRQFWDYEVTQFCLSGLPLSSPLPVLCTTVLLKIVPL